MSVANNPCNCLNATNLLNKIVALLECEVTKNDITRILEMMYSYIAISQYGFYVSDLANIMRLLEIGCDRFKDVPVFKDVLRHIFTICKIPPFMKVSSDVIRYSTDVREYFAVLGYILILINDIELQQILIETITSLLDTPAKYKNQLPLKVRRKEASSGRFPGLMGQALFLLDDELFHNFLDLTFKFIVDCPSVCKDLAINDALNALFTRMEGTWRSRYPDTHPEMDKNPAIEHLNAILAIFNSIVVHLCNHNEIVKDVPVITRFSLWNVKYIFHYVTTVTNWTVARNNIMSCILYVLELFPTMDFVPSGLAEALVADGLVAAKHAYDLMWTKNRDSPEDFYFVRAFLFSMPLYLNFPHGKSVFERSRLVNKILKLINVRGSLKPPIEHACVLRILGYKVFNQIVRHLQEEFIESSGPVILLNLLKKLDHSRSGLTISMNCLDTIRCVVKSDAKQSVTNSILFNDGFNILIDVLKDIMKCKEFSDGAQICLEEIFGILTKLFTATSTVRCDLIELVKLPLKLLERFLHPRPEEPIYDNRILINVINFVWEVIVKNEVLHKLFFDGNGVYILLDIIQAFGLPVQTITLGALVDFCDYSAGKCIPFLITWKGKKGVTFFPLLMQIFRNENKLIGVKTGKRGEIGDGERPLMGKQQYQETFEKKNFKINPTIVDMSASCRPKIYALLTQVFERYKDIYEAANEAYKTCNEELSAKDKMTLLLAENYLGLKFGEAWEELMCEFQEINFKPLVTDAAMLTSLVERTQKWGQKLKEVQLELLEIEKVKNWVTEQETYNKLRDSRISAALESINEAKYIARCTEKMFRISQKFSQINQVERSMAKIEHGAGVHKTFMSTIPITRVFRQNVRMKSDFKDEDAAEKVEDCFGVEGVPVKPPEEEAKKSLLKTATDQAVNETKTVQHATATASKPGLLIVEAASKAGAQFSGMQPKPREFKAPPAYAKRTVLPSPPDNRTPADSFMEVDLQVAQLAEDSLMLPSRTSKLPAPGLKQPLF